MTKLVIRCDDINIVFHKFCIAVDSNILKKLIKKYKTKTHEKLNELKRDYMFKLYNQDIQKLEICNKDAWLKFSDYVVYYYIIRLILHGNEIPINNDFGKFNVKHI